MLRALVASLRLAIAIVCIGISLVLAGIWLGLLDHPLRLIAFFVVSGTAVYWVFVLYVMRGFEVTQVVPDRIRDALDALSEGLLVMDERDRIVLANKAFVRMIGVSQESLIGQRAGSLPWACSTMAGPEDFPWLRAVRYAQPQIEQLMRYQLPNDSIRYFSINASHVSNEDSKWRGSLATFRDVTQSEEYRAQREQTLAMLRNSRDEISHQNAELQILATQDSLTQCLNRRALTDSVDAVWESTLANGSFIACLMIDNDHFKHVNDNFGHPAGDEVLRRVSKVLREQFTTPAMVCRYGGEEFCVLLPDTSLETAAELAEKTRASIEAVRLTEIPELRLTVSIGVSETRFGAANPQALIAQADECLYVAKGSGRNRVVAYQPS